MCTAPAASRIPGNSSPFKASARVDWDRPVAIVRASSFPHVFNASVAESVDAADSKSVVGNNVPVRVGPEAPRIERRVGRDSRIVDPRIATRNQRCYSGAWL
jgi:hypothetical protein